MATVIVHSQHPVAVGFCCLDGGSPLVIVHGVAFQTLGEGSGGLVVGDFHLSAALVEDGDHRLSHQAIHLLGAHAGTGGALRQIILCPGGGNLDDGVVVQGNVVDKGGVPVQLDHIVGACPVKVDLHRAQLPVGNFLQILQLVGAGGLVLVRQSEGGNLFAAQANHILLVAGQACGGFQIRQLLIAYLVLHVGDVGILTLIGGILGTGGFIQGAPVRVGEQLGEDLLRLGGGLRQLKVGEPAVEPVQADEGAQEEHQNEQEIQGVENHAAQPGAGFLLLADGRLLGGHRPSGGRPLSVGAARRTLCGPGTGGSGGTLAAGTLGVCRMGGHTAAGSLTAGRGGGTLGIGVDPGTLGIGDTCRAGGRGRPPDILGSRSRGGSLGRTLDRLLGGGGLCGLLGFLGILNVVQEAQVEVQP